MVSKFCRAVLTRHAAAITIVTLMRAISSALIPALRVLREEYRQAALWSLFDVYQLLATDRCSASLFGVLHLTINMKQNAPWRALTPPCSIAVGGLRNINTQLGLVSNNVANASTPDYSVETASQQTPCCRHTTFGRADRRAATRAIDLALQQAAFQQDTVVSGLDHHDLEVCNKLDALCQGLGGSRATDLGSLPGAKVQSSFADFARQPGQRGATIREVVSAIPAL